MPDSSCVIERFQENSLYASSMKTLYGDNIFDKTEKAYDALAESIADGETGNLDVGLLGNSEVNDLELAGAFKSLLYVMWL